MGIFINHVLQMDISINNFYTSCTSDGHIHKSCTSEGHFHKQYLYIIVRLVPGYQPVNPQKLSLAYVTVTSRISGPPLEKTKGPAGESTRLSLAYVTVTSRGAAHWGIHTLY